LPILDPRGQLLRAAVGFAGCSMPSYDRALWALRTWLDSWSGIGHVAVGMQVHVKPGAALDDAIHRVAPFRMISRRRPEEPHRRESELRAHGNSRGCRRLPRHT